MASQTAGSGIQMQAFYPQPGIAAAPGGGAQGMIASPAFYGSSLGGATAAAAAPGSSPSPYTIWPAGQPLMYANPGAAGFYTQAIYQTALQAPTTEVSSAMTLIPAQTIDGHTTGDALPKSDAGATALSAGPIPQLMPASSAMTAIPLTGAGLPQVSSAMAAAAMAGQPMLAGQPIQVSPEYWAQAQAQAALQAQAMAQNQARPGNALVAQNLAAVASAVAAATGQPGAAIPGQEFYALDEREIKRQRRKQSNRESARRSRLRKQAECEDLNKKVELVAEDNVEKKRELARLKALAQRLSADNTELMLRLGNVAGIKSNGLSAQSQPWAAAAAES